MTHSIKTLLIASLCCALFASVGISQASAEEAANYKIGVVDVQAVLAKYEKRKTKYEDLQKQVESLQTEIDSMSKKIEAAKADYDKRKRELSETELVELENKIKNDYADYQNELTKSQQKIDSMEELVLKEVLKDIQESIQKVAENGNYHLVLNNGAGPRSAVLFAHNSIDITSQILADLNK